MSKVGYCAECRQIYDTETARKCPKCGATEVTGVIPQRSLAPAAGLQMSGVVDRIEAAQYGQTEPETVRLSITWGDAFSIGFKLMVVFSIFQAVFLLVAFLIWGN